jgi:hypothetical protein
MSVRTLVLFALINAELSAQPLTNIKAITNNNLTPFIKRSLSG